MTTLYRATDSTYAIHCPPGPWQWWTPSRSWAEHYGSVIIERPSDNLVLLDLPLDGPDVREALDTAGIDTSDISFTMDDLHLDLEVHQILSDALDGPLLARRIKSAGYDGVRHPDHIYEIGIGVAVALIGDDP